MVPSEKTELVATRPVTRWRVYIDQRKLNTQTQRDHFLMPFIVKMLDRLTKRSRYYFLNSYSRYYQISIALKDQEKTISTTPYGTFAFQGMPFKLCNSPTTFLYYMMSIFFYIVEHNIDVFIDEFLIIGDSFDDYMAHLANPLQRYKKYNLGSCWVLQEIHYGLL